MSVKRKRLRRGCGIAAVVIMLAAINLAVIGSVNASGTEAQTGALRAETARAFYAAESGGRIIIKCNNQGLALPAVNSTLTMGQATVTYVSLPAANSPGDAVVRGADGTTTRRLKITLSAP